ncbi:hypothetical protein ILYODFUR_036124 [Ilyodon furcidens]|uniref:Uncharacterized protein n=1 Tax=Ilyodon furcidens TaxID=33524 RepID=A0ABV0V0R2_9TELE
MNPMNDMSLNERFRIRISNVFPPWDQILVMEWRPEEIRELEGASKPDIGDGVEEGRSSAGEQGDPWLEVLKSEALKGDWLRRNADLTLIDWSGDA